MRLARFVVRDAPMMTPAFRKFLIEGTCATAIMWMAACSDPNLFPSSPSPVSPTGGAARSSSAARSGVEGRDYHEPYPSPYPSPYPEPPGGEPMPPIPPVFAIVPDAGPATGGTPITISGLNVMEGMTVDFGTERATDVVLLDATSLTAMTPPNVEGGVDVVVTNPDGHSHTLIGGFTYVAAAVPDMPPTITITPMGVSPKAIQIVVGTQVTFVNNDIGNRALQSDPHPLHTDCPELNTLGFMPPGSSMQTDVFLAPRTCGFHDHDDPTNEALRGRIVIQAPPPEVVP
jgi:hypothetical protein